MFLFHSGLFRGNVLQGFFGGNCVPIAHGERPVMSISSPFESVHEQMVASFADYHGWRLPSHYGDQAAEDKALCEACAAFDLSSFGKITIEGSASQTLIDDLLTADEECADGQWVWASSRNEGSIGRLRLARQGGGYTLFTLPQQREQLLSLARECANQCGGGDVAIADITENTAMLAMYGPQAVEAVTSIMPFDIGPVGENGIMSLSFFMMKVTIVGGSWLSGSGVELLCPKSAASMAAAAMARYHEKQNITPAGMDCLSRALAEKQIIL